MTFKQTGCIGLKRNLPLKLTIENLGPGIVAENSVVIFDSGAFFNTATHYIGSRIEKNGTYFFEIDLKPTRSNSLETMPEQIMVTLYTPDGKTPHRCRSAGFVVEMGGFSFLFFLLFIFIFIFLTPSSSNSSIFP